MGGATSFAGTCGAGHISIPHHRYGARPIISPLRLIADRAGYRSWADLAEAVHAGAWVNFDPIDTPGRRSDLFERLFQDACDAYDLVLILDGADRKKIRVGSRRVKATLRYAA